MTWLPYVGEVRAYRQFWLGDRFVRYWPRWTPEVRFF